ncbi:permease, partial [Kineococcus glutinatus]|uniref:permease n=1 Tax=Kineococcus glutinatus TaxID=1070872 RepID=UPI0031EC49B5
RLATLRLLGAPPRLVRGVVGAELAVVAAAGALAGVVLAVLLSPLVGAVRFRGEAVGADRLWLGVPAVLAVVAAVVALAALSGLLGLRRVVIEPLGVRARRSPPPQRWVRAGVGAGVVLTWVLAWQLGSTTLRSSLALVALLGGGMAACLGVLSLVGPFAVALLARRSLRRADTPQRLLAARSVLDDPRAAWRQVAGVAMTSFVGVVAGVGLALAGSAGTSGGADAELVADVRTGVLLTLLISFAVVACSVGVTAAAAVLDRRDLWVALDRVGMPRPTMEAARTRAVLAPLRQVALGSALLGAVAVLPVTGAALVLDPLAVLVVAVCLALGIALVALALRATRPVLTGVLAAPERV